jgi:hypothetical protein
MEGSEEGRAGKDEGERRERRRENEGREGGIREVTAMKGWEGKMEDEEDIMKEKKEVEEGGTEAEWRKEDRGRVEEGGPRQDNRKEQKGWKEDREASSRHLNPW